LRRGCPGACHSPSTCLPATPTPHLSHHTPPHTHHTCHTTTHTPSHRPPSPPPHCPLPASRELPTTLSVNVWTDGRFMLGPVFGGLPSTSRLPPSDNPLPPAGGWGHMLPGCMVGYHLTLGSQQLPLLQLTSPPNSTWLWPYLPGAVVSTTTLHIRRSYTRLPTTSPPLTYLGGYVKTGGCLGPLPPHLMALPSPASHPSPPPACTLPFGTEDGQTYHPAGMPVFHLNGPRACRATYPLPAVRGRDFCHAATRTRTFSTCWRFCYRAAAAGGHTPRLTSVPVPFQHWHSPRMIGPPPALLAHLLPHLPHLDASPRPRAPRTRHLLRPYRSATTYPGATIHTAYHATLPA